MADLIVHKSKEQKTKQTIKGQKNYMGFNAILSADDLKKGDLLEPGWYVTEIDSYTEKDAKTDKSTNCYFSFKVLDGKYKGVPSQAMFNEKALGFGKKLWEALKLPREADGGYKLSSELFHKIAASRPKVKIYVVRGKSDRGNEFNDIQDYQAVA